jgi:hypothetical protein
MASQFSYRLLFQVFHLISPFVANSLQTVSGTRRHAHPERAPDSRYGLALLSQSSHNPAKTRFLCAYALCLQRAAAYNRLGNFSNSVGF